MKITSLLEQHRKFSDDPLALKDALGDGFLMRHNSIYGRIRVAAVKKGFSFSKAQNDAYRALPLSQLEHILSQREIPYIDNVSVLKEIEARIPRQTLWNDISDNLKGNSLFHEACHAVARVTSLPNDLERETRIDNANARTLALLLEESFANANELLSILDAEDAVHRIFLELNSYVYLLEDRVHLKAAADDVGHKALLKLVWLSYLHANFLREPSDRDFDCMLALSGIAPSLDPKKKKSLRQMSKVAMKLNPRFREVTTRFYLRLTGLQQDITVLLNFDFLKAIEASSAVQSYLQTHSD